MSTSASTQVQSCSIQASWIIYNRSLNPSPMPTRIIGNPFGAKYISLSKSFSQGIHITSGDQEIKTASIWDSC
jgi:hypothetical protein